MCITAHRDKPFRPFKSVDPMKIDAGVITAKEGEILEVRHGNVVKIILERSGGKSRKIGERVGTRPGH